MSDYYTPPAILDAIGLRIYDPAHAGGAWPVTLPASAAPDWTAVLANPPFTGGDTVSEETELDALRALITSLDTVSMHVAVQYAQAACSPDRPLRRELLDRVRADVLRLESAAAAIAGYAPAGARRE